MRLTGKKLAAAGFVLVVLVVVATTRLLALYTDQDAVGANTFGSGAVNQGSTPSASAVGQTVTVTWSATTLTNGQAVSGYLVKRYDAITPFAEQAILSACTGTITALTCAENSVPGGSWTYSVTPVFADNWQGLESARSTAVVVETTPPVNAITLSGVSGGAYKSGDTVYYRGTTAGSFTLTNAVTDGGSGPASSATAALTGVTTGWTHTPSTVSTPSGGPYVSNAFAWADATTTSPSEAVTGRDAAGNTAATTLTFVNDSTAPGAGTVDYPNTYTAGRSVAVTFTTGTDAGSGIATRQLQRASATLTGGSCGSYSGFANTGGVNPASPYTDIYVSSGKCYQYRYVVTDNVGNQHIATSSNVAKVDYAGAVGATSGAISHWRLGEADTSVASDSYTGSDGTLLTSHTGEVGATWTYHLGTNNEQLINGRITSTDSGRAVYSASATPSSANYAVEADVYYRGALAGDMTGVFGRGNTATPSFYLARYDMTDTTWKIIKYSGTTATVLDTSTTQTLTVGNSYRLRLEMSGSSTTYLYLYVGGSMRAYAEDSSSPYTSAGKAGIMEGESGSSVTKSTTAGLHLDNFRVTSLRAADSKGTNHGVYQGAVTLGATGAINNDADTAATYDGTNDYTWASREVSGDFSAEFWFKSTQGIGTSSNWYSGAALVDNTHATDTTNDWGTSLRSDGKVTFGVGNPNTTIVSSTSGYNDGNWHHVVATRQASNGALKLYVDGTERASAASGPTAARTAVSWIAFAAQAQDTSNDLAGTVDEVSLYTSVLSQTTVTNHYELSTPPPAEPTGPSGGSVDAGGLVGTGSRYSTSTTLSINLDKGTDTDGVAATGAQLLRATATLTSTAGADGTCGSYGSYSLITGGNDPVSPKSDAVSDQACYRYQYVVADTLGNNTTYTSGDIKVDSSAPSAPTFSFSAFSNTYWSGSGSTVYYRPAASTGGFTVTASATDAKSGVASYAFPSLGTNWSSTPGSLGVNAYSWSGAPAAPGSPTVTATNHATVTSGTGAFTLTIDSTAPSAGTVSYLDGDTTSSTVSVSFTTGTDGGSGIGTRLLQRASATLTGSTCGSFGGFTTVTNGTNPSSPLVNSVSSSTCYKYQYVVSDNVGNQHVASSSNVVKVTTSYSGTVLATSGLLDYYRLGESSGTTLNDSNGTNHGSYVNSPTLGVTGAIAGDSNTAVQFDGVSDHATLTRQISDDFTIEFWFKSTQGIGTDPRWTQGAGLVDCNITGSNNDFGTSLRSDGHVVAGVGGGGGDTSVVSTASGYNDGQWHYVAFVRTKSSGVFTLYVDGASAGTATNNTSSLTAQSTISIGRLSTPGNYFAGTIDEVAIYNVALSGATISAHYAAR